jgi:sarcosine oxidase
MGCAAAYNLAKDGQRVFVLEQFTIGNRNGSSHGASRQFRLIHDGTDYVQLARAAYAAWRELEADANETLLQQVARLGSWLGDHAGGFSQHVADRWRVVRTTRLR